MNILLVNPPNSGRSIPEEEYGIETIKTIFRGEPLALETLAGNLSGHEVFIADLKAEKDFDLFARRPDLVGITGVTCEANAVIEIAESIKSRHGSVVVVGGHHASCDPSFFNRECIDYVVVGLGKASFRQLVDAIEKGEKNPQIPGIARTNPSGLIFSPRKYSSADLVDEAAPRYDLVAHNRDLYVMSGVGGKVGFVASAFGCTFGCSFCSIGNLTGGRYLTHSIEAVIRDIGILDDLKLIRLVDANTFGTPETARALAEAILSAGIRKSFVADLRSDTVVRHPDLMEIWKEAGLVAAVIGMEEVEDDRLAEYDKKNSVGTNLEAVSILKDMGIRVIGDFIVSPDYGPEEFDQLEAFVEKSRIDLPLPAILTPIPGTPLYRRMKDRIEIENLDYYTFTNAVIPTRMPKKEFYQTYADLLRRFLSHVNHQ